MSRRISNSFTTKSTPECVDEQLAARNHRGAVECSSDVQAEHAKKRIRDLIEEGLSSGPGRRRTKADETELLTIARSEMD